MPDPIEDLAAQLAQLIRGLRSLHATIVETAGHNVEASAFGLLAGLAKLGPVRLSTLASAMYLDLSTISRQVPALERQGWVERTRDPDDHRAQLLELTPAGREMLETVRRARGEVLTRLLPDWTPDDLRRFAEQIARFNDDVSHHRQALLPVLTSAAPAARTERA